MDDLLNKANALTNLLDYVPLDDNAASVLHTLETKINEKLQAINYQPTMYIMYSGQQGMVQETTIYHADAQGQRAGTAVVGKRGRLANKPTKPKVISSDASLKKHRTYTDEEKRFACSMCNYRATRKDMVKQHMKIHTGEKPYACSQCAYKTAYKGDLVKHIRKHSGERPYKCGTCSQRFGDITGLRSHMRSHTGEKPYKCSFCVYRAAQAASVRTHIRLIHMKDRPFKCSYCNYSTGLAGSLKVHERMHTGEKPYACPTCEFRCASTSELKKHQKSHMNPETTITDMEKCDLCDSGITHTEGEAYKCDQCEFVAEKCYGLYTHKRTHEMPDPQEQEVAVIMSDVPSISLDMNQATQPMAESVQIQMGANMTGAEIVTMQNNDMQNVQTVQYTI